KDELPRHEVCVDGFWMGKYEVTNTEYVQFLNEIGKRGTEEHPWFETEKEDSSSKIQGEVGGFKVKSGYERHPVNNVSWYGAVAYIEWLSKKNGKKYRLPTEAEWEYAARAKSSYIYSGGDTLDIVAWYNGNSDGTTHPVGKKQANDFGLYDMSGNVWEWCADWYDGKYYASSSKPKHNPTGPSSGSNRVIRGGGWSGNPRIVRSAYRYRGTPGSRYYDLGFRLALPVQQDR
ncbi:MAG: formylglycine-generating enzyme family protein, partial [Candidatus Electrothrix sp.]